MNSLSPISVAIPVAPEAESDFAWAAIDPDRLIAGQRPGAAVALIAGDVPCGVCDQPAPKGRRRRCWRYNRRRRVNVPMMGLAPDRAIGQRGGRRADQQGGGNNEGGSDGHWRNPCVGSTPGQARTASILVSAKMALQYQSSGLTLTLVSVIPGRKSAPRNDPSGSRVSATTLITCFIKIEEEVHCVGGGPCARPHCRVLRSTGRPQGPPLRRRTSCHPFNLVDALH